VGGRAGIVASILVKDVRMFARDRFYVVVSVIGLVFYVLVFWILPASVDETIGLGIHLPGGEALLEGVPIDEAEGFAVHVFGSADELASAVEAGDDVAAGLDFPPGFVEAVSAGQATTVRALLAADAPEGLRPALVSGVREMAFGLAGDEPPVAFPELEESIVGPDRTGQQLSLRERVRPLFIFLVLLVEMFALAALVAAEISQRTVTAVLATPARVSDLLAAKAVFGTLLAFSQVLLLVVATGSFTAQMGVLLVGLLLGALLVTGFGLLAGSTGQDFVGIVFWSMLFLIPLAVPAVAALFPGAAAGWIQALPTYGLVEVIIGAASYAQGFADVWPHLLALTAWCAVILAVGVAVLGRRVARV
jgi:ABC-2 type transport system permease protein